jgi:hypothetical protein
MVLRLVPRLRSAFPGVKIKLRGDAGFAEHRVGKRMVSLKDDVVAWFESLPSHYDGERLRARIIDAGNVLAQREMEKRRSPLV